MRVNVVIALGKELYEGSVSVQSLVLRGQRGILRGQLCVLRG